MDWLNDLPAWAKKHKNVVDYCKVNLTFRANVMDDDESIRDGLKGAANGWARDQRENQPKINNL